MIGDLRHARQRAQVQAGPVQHHRAELRAQLADVDHGLWLHDAKLHQVQQHGAAGEILRARVGAGPQRIWNRARLLVAEGLHQACSIASFACATAATIFG